MACAAAAARVAVEVLMEEQQVAPMWIVRVPRVVTMARPAAGCIAQEDRRDASRDLARDLTQGQVTP
jgi:hypothetical protein